MNGTFGYRSSRGYDYDSSYTSHSHGWSSGPTSSLTEFVLGLSVTSPGGQTWNLAPQFGDLKTVEGGFTTGLGKYQAAWAVEGRGYTLSYNVPAGTKGQLVLPFLIDGKIPDITFDKKGLSGSMRPQIGDYGVTLEVEGGKHAIVVR